MTHQPQTTTNYEQALDLLISGNKTKAEVLAMFPKLSTNELDQLLATVALIETARQETQPTSVMLDDILSTLTQSSVTQKKSLRYINEQEAHSSKGRSYFNKLFNEFILNFMNKQTYLATGVIVLVIIVAVGIYTFSPSKTSDNNIELAYVTDNLNQDLSDLDALVNDQALAGVDADLTALANSDDTDAPHEDIPFDDNTTQNNKVDVSALDDLTDELGTDLDDLTGDLSDLSSSADDSSLAGLDSSLAGF